MPLYRGYDLPCCRRAGRSIPRVLLEAMAAVCRHRYARRRDQASSRTAQRLLIDESSGRPSPRPRQASHRRSGAASTIIQGGYGSPRTLEAQAARMMAELRSRLPALAA
jgi:hypothetical protein